MASPWPAEVQRANVEAAARAVAAIAGEHHLVLTHGNGPQVGLLALQNAAYTDVPSYPLDVLDAESEGMVGYMLEQELGRDLPPDGLATLLTQVVVDPDDPAFARPTKPVGPSTTRSRRNGWLGAIGSLSDTAAILRGEAGTRLRGSDVVREASTQRMGGDGRRTGSTPEPTGARRP